jgi:hypothetical protein
VATPSRCWAPRRPGSPLSPGSPDARVLPCATTDPALGRVGLLCAHQPSKARLIRFNGNHRVTPSTPHRSRPAAPSDVGVAGDQRLHDRPPDPTPSSGHPGVRQARLPSPHSPANCTAAAASDVAGRNSTFSATAGPRGRATRAPGD